MTEPHNKSPEIRYKSNIPFLMDRLSTLSKEESKEIFNILLMQHVYDLEDFILSTIANNLHTVPIQLSDDDLPSYLNSILTYHPIKNTSAEAVVHIDESALTFPSETRTVFTADGLIYMFIVFANSEAGRVLLYERVTGDDDRG